MNGSVPVKVTLVYAYYDNGDMLRRHLQEWLEYPPEAKILLKVIIVDDASPNKPAAEIIRAFGYTGMDIEVYRVSVNIPWNQDGARNLGMRACRTEWALLLDMDHMLPKRQVMFMLGFAKRFAEPRMYYMPGQVLTNETNIGSPHPNQYLIRKDDFWSMGGYDEDFAGWYGSDGNFRKCAKGAGLIEMPIDHFYTMAFRGADIADARTNEFGRKESPYYSPNNPELNAKRRGPPYKAINPIRFAYRRVL